jgi:hypothetical protein
MSSFSRSHIGIDLDNTLISYDRLFTLTAAQRGFIPPDFSGPKREVRDHIRLLPDGEMEWQRLQAHVYGPAIGGALATEGALEFIHSARADGAQLSIVSHKTTFSNLGTESFDLRAGAREWLESSGMLGTLAVPEDRLFFEDTREQKIARIIALGCTHFIDDLEEIFNDPSFPAGVRSMLLSTSVPPPQGPFETFASFNEIARAFATD